MEPDFDHAVTAAADRHRKVLRHHTGWPRSDGQHVLVTCGCRVEFRAEDWPQHLNELCGETHD